MHRHVVDNGSLLPRRGLHALYGSRQVPAPVPVGSAGDLWSSFSREVATG
jgi:hypothetical protein